jgi:hypothetical protein
MLAEHAAIIDIAQMVIGAGRYPAGADGKDEEYGNISYGFMVFHGAIFPWVFRKKCPITLCQWTACGNRRQFDRVTRVNFVGAGQNATICATINALITTNSQNFFYCKFTFWRRDAFVFSAEYHWSWRNVM